MFWAGTFRLLVRLAVNTAKAPPNEPLPALSVQPPPRAVYELNLPCHDDFPVILLPRPMRLRRIDTMVVPVRDLVDPRVIARFQRAAERLAARRSSRCLRPRPHHARRPLPRRGLLARAAHAHERPVALRLRREEDRPARQRRVDLAEPRLHPLPQRLCL